MATLQSNMGQLQVSAVLMPGALRTILMGKGVADLRAMAPDARTSMISRWGIAALPAAADAVAAADLLPVALHKPLDAAVQHTCSLAMLSS